MKWFKRFPRWQLLFFFSLALGAFLRFYRLPENVIFSAESGDNYLAIKNFFATETIPLLGPPTSHPWLSFGPLFYWFFGPILALFKFNPTVGSYFFAIIGTSLILLNFLVVKRFFGDKVAAISSFLISFSYAWVKLTHESRFFSLSALFFYPFLFFLLENRLFLAGVFLGIMFNFHLSPIILLLPTALYIYWHKKAFSRKDIYYGILGFSIPNIPFLLYNTTHKFEMLISLFTWIPYRIAGFVGVYPKNTASVGVLKSNIVSLYEFIGNMFTPDNGTIWLVGFGIIFTYVLIKFYQNWKNKRKNWPIFLLILLFIFGYLGVFIHGNPPVHYYLPIYPLPIIFFSLFFAETGAGKIMNYLVIFVLVSFLIINLKFYFSDKWFYIPQDKITESFAVPYGMQLAATRSIISDANGQKFVMHRVGPNDNFEGDYAQNFRYLLWWEGNEPTDKANIRYTVYEVDARLPKTFTGMIVYKKDGLTVIREANEQK